jgi:hypothetical protein
MLNTVVQLSFVDEQLWSCEVYLHKMRTFHNALSMPEPDLTCTQAPISIPKSCSKGTEDAKDKFVALRSPLVLRKTTHKVCQRCYPSQA